MNFNEKNILITGASTGIGRAIAVALKDFNCNVFLTARRKSLLDRIIEENQNYSANYYSFEHDVAAKQSVQEVFNSITKLHGNIDVAILNAAIGNKVAVKKFNSVHAEQTFQINFLGIVYWIEKLLPSFIERKNGVIVGVSSLADNRGYSRSGFYSASKAALSNFLEGLRIDTHNYGVKIITVKPGFVKTPMTDKNNFAMPFMMDSDRAAKIILKGIEKEKALIAFPLRTVIGSKIIGLLPNRLYEYLARKYFKS
ncbi:MAG: SDR family NAD(P)-dependent oxidoreductase [Bacteroidetes bacterium]|nr:SDR family NAD(P)-dependent oxidoreductase [Bacteroidota bacterium]MBU1679716.1 SDR family NAD(P)-dependent oxidoreductase [Bacteroidota bacterium]